MSDIQHTTTSDGASGSKNLNRYLFIMTLCCSAFLLFLIQPMFTKLVLPLLGGAPAIWNTAMIFFQAMLLGGYVYAHFLSSHFKLKNQIIIHLSIMILAIISLPIAIPSGFESPSENWPTAWLLLLFFVAIGLPFFVISANAPLLQDWFRSSGDKHAHDPYFLYAASNVGSIGALIAYPLFIEVFFGLSNQGILWSIGFGLLLTLILSCGLILLKIRSTQLPPLTSDTETQQENTSDIRKPSLSNYAYWIILAFIPSAYLLSVTNKITTDLLATPLLWVIPLTLYLLTFVIVFSRKPILSHQLIAKIAPYCVLVLAFFNMSISQADTVLGVILTSLIGFFIITLYCHGKLAETRPPAKFLTNFYIAMSFGGVLGGIFVGIVAPTIFSNIYEYALLLILAAFLMPTSPKSMFGLINKKIGSLLQSYKADFIVALFVLGILLTARNVPFEELNIKPLSYAILFVMLLFLIDSTVRPLRLGICVALGLFFSGQLTGLSEGFVFQERSFFGVYTVKKEKDEDNIKRPYSTANIAKHGTTIHGIQRIGSLEPLSYYHAETGLGKLLQAYEVSGIPLKEIGAIGLGAGTAICYRKPEQNWAFFEIDPLVELMARDPRLFTYMSSCGRDIPVIIGDARLSLQKITDKKYDILIADAFSSDSIPVHLLTKEAFELYQNKIKNDGIIILHVSNRYFKLEPIVAKASNSLGLTSRIYHFERTDEELKSKPYRFNSTWIALAKKASVLDALVPLATNTKGKKDNLWRNLEFNEKDQLWTDDYSNVLSALNPYIWAPAK